MKMLRRQESNQAWKHHACQFAWKIVTFSWGLKEETRWSGNDRAHLFGRWNRWASPRWLVSLLRLLSRFALIFGQTKGLPTSKKLLALSSEPGSTWVPVGERYVKKRLRWSCFTKWGSTYFDLYNFLYILVPWSGRGLKPPRNVEGFRFCCFSASVTFFWCFLVKKKKKRFFRSYFLKWIPTCHMFLFPGWGGVETTPKSRRL